MPLIRVLSTVLMVSVLLSCRRVPELRPRLIGSEERVGLEFWMSAPYVVAVKIARAELRRSWEPVFAGGPKDMHLVEFTANVENTIKGDLPPGRTISFFYFVRRDTKPMCYLYPGKRYLVSLRKEGEVLRSFADGTQLYVQIHSGTHNQNDIPLDLGPAAAITWLLTTPGADCNLKEFASFLGVDGYDYPEPAYLNQRLQELQRSSNQFLRDRACLTAAAELEGYDPECLDECLKSPDSRTRQAAAEHLNEKSHLAEVLRNNPASLFFPWSTNITQTLIVFTEDRRPEVREAACAALRAFAAPAVPARCNSGERRPPVHVTGRR